MGACYTGDKNIVDKMHKKNESLSNDDIDTLFDLFYVTIYHEKIDIIPLLCTWYASRLETLLQSCKLHITYDNPAHIFDWYNFLANHALFNNRKKAFETLIKYYKEYLNIVDKKGRKYLDCIVKDYQEYRKIVMKYGGMGKEETITMIMDKSIY